MELFASTFDKLQLTSGHPNWLLWDLSYIIPYTDQAYNPHSAFFELSFCGIISRQYLDKRATHWSIGGFYIQIHNPEMLSRTVSDVVHEQM